VKTLRLADAWPPSGGQASAVLGAFELEGEHDLGDAVEQL
jgi:hypothetical protein